MADRFNTIIEDEQLNNIIDTLQYIRRRVESPIPSRIIPRYNPELQNIFDSHPNLIQHSREIFDIFNNDRFDNLIDIQIDNFISSFGNTLLEHEVNTDLEDVKVTLTKEQFDSLENNNLPYDKDCNICIESLDNNTFKTKLSCNHIYHTECIKTWLLNSSTKCPCCRTDVRS